MDQFLDKCWTTFRAIWGDPFWDQIGPRGSRCAQKGHPEPQSTENLHVRKPVNNYCVLMFFGIQGHPRQRRKAEEGSREAPEELQNLKNRDPKMDLIFTSFWTNFGAILESVWGAKSCPKRVPKRMKNGTCFGTACSASQGPLRPSRALQGT